MIFKGFTPSTVEKNFFVDSVDSESRGTCISLRDMYGSSRVVSGIVKDTRMLDANFAFLSTTLAKLHEKLYEPKYNITYLKDIPVNYGGGFVDYVEYYTVDWAGIMDEFRNLMGNDANFIPRVNAGLNQKRVNVYTFEVAYDLRFVELEKMKKLTLQKSIEEIYKNAIVAGWDLFAQKVAYTGIKGSFGLFNSPSVMTTTIDNNAATSGDNGFDDMSDEAIVSFFNGVFEVILKESGNNPALLPDTFLVPTFVGRQLTSRFSALYTSTLRKFIIEHNLGVDETDGDLKVTIRSREALNTLGGHGRIVTYRKDPDFVRIDVPYPMQLFITLPNIDKMSYTSAFVGQVSQIQLPYNTSNTEQGVVNYWDFTK